MVLRDHLLLSTTGGHYPITSCSQPAASTVKEGEGKGTTPLAKILGGRAEARQHTKHFSISPSVVSSGHTSPPNGTMRVGYGVVPPGSTHFMGLKRACP